MPRSDATTTKRRGGSKPRKIEPRYTVALAPELVHQVRRYAETTEMSMSKAIAALVRHGLENREHRKREFFKRLRENLSNDDPEQEDRLVEEFRTLILGR